jgi:hypothetical protein
LVLPATLYSTWLFKAEKLATAGLLAKIVEKFTHKA